MLNVKPVELRVLSHEMLNNTEVYMCCIVYMKDISRSFVKLLYSNHKKTAVYLKNYTIVKHLRSTRHHVCN